MLVGSEGTLAFTADRDQALAACSRNRALGVCHFGSFHEAMDAAQHIVKLKPIAVELVDRTMIGAGRDIAMFQPTIEAVVRGDPQAMLLVEFAEEDQAENLRRLKQLGELMGDLGFGWDDPQRKWGGVVEVTDPAMQAAIADFRAAGLNIMMSMKETASRSPLSRIARCRSSISPNTPTRLNEVFAKHGTKGTFYAHA